MKNAAISLTCVTKDDDIFYPQIFSEDTLVPSKIFSICIQKTLKIFPIFRLLVSIPKCSITCRPKCVVMVRPKCVNSS